MLDQRLQAALDSRRQRGVLRQLTTFDDVKADSTSCSAKAAGKRRWVDFSSNDYLSLATCDEIKAAYMRNLTRFAAQNPYAPITGSSGSRLLDGNSTLAEQLERDLARHFYSQDALLFNTGFAANASLLATLPQPTDVILYDSLVHASMHDGMRKSRARAHAFAHNDLHSLEEQLRIHARADEAETLPRIVFLAVESVYSMDGDLCSLRELVKVALRHVPRQRLCVIVDEAHGAALYGPRGEGLTVAAGVQAEVDIRLVTFGKAFGSSGAAVLCSNTVKQFLINYARPLIYSTSLPATTLLSIRTSLEALCTPWYQERRRRLFTNVSQLQSLLGLRRSVAEAGPLSPIVPLLLAHPKRLAAYLQERDIIVRGITYPTVPQGQDRVRICVHASNTQNEISELARLIAEWNTSKDASQPPDFPSHL